MNPSVNNDEDLDDKKTRARPLVTGQAELLDGLRRRLQLDSDKALAEALGLKPPFVSELRAGKRPMPTFAKLKIMDKLGYLWARDALLALTPQGFSQKIKEADNARFSIDLSGLDDELPPPPVEFSQIVAAAIESHGPDSVATVVKAELLAYKTRAAAKK